MVITCTSNAARDLVQVVLGRHHLFEHTDYLLAGPYTETDAPHWEFIFRHAPDPDVARALEVAIAPLPGVTLAKSRA